MTRLLKMFLASAIATAGMAAVTAVPAQAANTDPFFVCLPAYCETTYTKGTITWHNRTATVTGEVVDIGTGYTVATFAAYANDGINVVHVGEDQTRSANDESELGWRRTFSFTLGDTNRVGGFNQALLDVCWIDIDGYSTCHGGASYWK